MKKAILFGASGFVGSYLLHELLNNSDYEQVIIVVRKQLDITHPKLSIITGDYHSFDDFKQHIVADDVFITLGITDYRIEHDYSVSIAKAAKENGAKSIFIITAVQADINSKSTYIKRKGEIERDVIALDFNHTYLFRVSMLMGRKEKNPIEKIMAVIWTVISPLMVGKYLKRYKGIDGKDVARAMNNAAKEQQGKVNICYWQEMQFLYKNLI